MACKVCKGDRQIPTLIMAWRIRRWGYKPCLKCKKELKILLRKN